MGAGKSTLGPELAERLGRSFVSVDEVVEERTGASVAELFAVRGEAAFRELEERAALDVLARRPLSVIELGGGGLGSATTRERLEESAFTLHLETTPEEAWERVASSGRPLARDRGQFQALFDERRALYESAAGSARNLDGAVLAAAGVHVSGGAIDRVGELVPGEGTVELVADEHVETLLGQRVRDALGARVTGSHVVPAGERAKSVAVAERLWSALRNHLGLLPAALEELVLREDRAGGLHLVAAGGAEPWDAAPLAAAAGVAGVAYWWRPRGGAARIVAGARTGFPALAFEQVNPELAVRIRQDALQDLGDVGGKIVWDLYGGVGDAARLLAAGGARVFSVDRDRSAIEWARGWAGAGTDITWFEGLVEETLHRLPEPDAVLVNPPRAGLVARVSAALQAWGESRPGARLCYVSCDPATLARDLTRLPAFALAKVRAYDLFPQTSHVETLAVLQAA